MRKIVSTLLLLLLAQLIILASDKKAIGDINSYKVEKDYIIYHCSGGEDIRLDLVANDIIRLRMAPNGKFDTSLSVKFGFVKEMLEDVPYATVKKDDKLIITTGSILVETSLNPFCLKIFDKAGKLIFAQSDHASISHDTINNLNVAKKNSEHFYGFGFMRATFDAAGKKLKWDRGYRWTEATVPFFMSTAGYGFYSNNTYIHNFDFTEKSKENDFYSVSNEGGQIDFFVFIGPGFKKILDSYTAITGKPKMVPVWAMSPEYRCRTYADQNDLLKIATRFREEDIPMSIIACEPGWEEKIYSDKYNWSPIRFPQPDSLVNALSSMGYRLDLWESGNAPKTDFTKEEVRNDWYKLHIPLIKQGVKMFKVDNPYPRQISTQELQDFIDVGLNKWESENYDFRELTNLINSLYTETVFNQFTKYSGGERGILMNHAYAASVASHRWPFQWGGDYGIGNARMNAGLSGHSIVSYDMDDPREAPYQSFASRIHAGYLIPFTVMNSWCDYTEPWAFPKDVEDIYRVYAKLKAKLYPYLYTTQWQSYKNAIPMLRPMLLEYQNDTVTFNLKDQYMLGDWLLVGLPGDVNLYRKRAKAFNEKNEKYQPEVECDSASVYLPKGTWFDYWTGIETQSPGKWIVAHWPNYAGGPLYVKGGAIIPGSQVTGYIGEEPLEVIELDVYPSAKSEYTYFEDDGKTYQYEQGKFATTHLSCIQNAGEVTLKIGKRSGSYNNMPSNRAFLVKLHAAQKPGAIKKDNVLLKEVKTKEALVNTKNSAGWYYDEGSATLFVKPSSAWYYDYDKRGKDKDAERDKVFWTTNAPFNEGDFQLKVTLPTTWKVAVKKTLQSKAAEATYKTVPDNGGRYKMQVLANPPEIVKLDDGSWMDGQVNIFVTITDAAGNIVDTDMPVKLHITGQSDRIPSDREVNAIHGIATFRDIFYKKPANYVFHISGDRVEMVNFPVFKN